MLAVQAKHWPGGATTLMGIKCGDKALNPTCGACPALMTQRFKKNHMTKKDLVVYEQFSAQHNKNVLDLGWVLEG